MNRPAQHEARGLGPALVLVIVVFAAFLPTFWNGFVLWDDDMMRSEYARFAAEAVELPESLDEPTQIPVQESRVG